LPDDRFHYILEVGWGLRKAKRHTEPAEFTAVAYETAAETAGFLELDIVEPRLEVNEADVEISA
jgi:hypothetical protein